MRSTGVNDDLQLAEHLMNMPAWRWYPAPHSVWAVMPRISIATSMQNLEKARPDRKGDWLITCRPKWTRTLNLAPRIGTPTGSKERLIDMDVEIAAPRA